MEEILETTTNCPHCGTLLFVDVDLFANNKKHSLLRLMCQNCGYDAPVKYDSEKGWIEWKD
jgi:transcription elongation factor Elf1